MRRHGRVRASLKTGCLATAFLLACVWLASRWVALDWQAGTRMAVSVDQGMVVCVLGEAPLDLAIEIVAHKDDQLGWQWWFAGFPHSFLVPLWVPTLVLVGLRGGLSTWRREQLLPAVTLAPE